MSEAIPRLIDLLLVAALFAGKTFLALGGLQPLLA
jgi:hypothetical protein